jgi:quercetin dioxygenase-like cupin family protein
MCVVGALLALVAVAVAPAWAWAQTRPAVPIVLARGQEDLPAGAMLFRVVDTTLPPGEPGVTHAHASGFDYAAAGTHVVTVDGVTRAVPEGQASWVGPMAEHTHAGLDGAGMRFWFLAFRPAATRGAPPMWP